MPDAELPNVDDLQFRRAQPIVAPESSGARSCAACKQLIPDEYYQVQNHVICPPCAAKIQVGRQTKRQIPWHRAILYGVGAALAGCILYAIPLALGFQIGIVALAVGYMVGKAIRAATYGVGGRPQQILAVALTYFAISISPLPAALFTGMKHAAADHSAGKNQEKIPSTPAAPPAAKPKGSISAAQVAAGFLVLIAVSPFLELFSSPVGGLISLFILFIGLQRAWALTAGHEILVTGPFTCSPSP